MLLFLVLVVNSDLLNFMELHVFAQAARSYVLLAQQGTKQNTTSVVDCDVLSEQPAATGHVPVFSVSVLMSPSVSMTTCDSSVTQISLPLVMHRCWNPLSLADLNIHVHTHFSKKDSRFAAKLCKRRFEKWCSTIFTDTILQARTAYLCCMCPK